MRPQAIVVRNGLLLRALLASLLFVQVSSAAFDGDDADAIATLIVPLENGRLPVRGLLESACEAVGIDHDNRFAGMTWSINVRSASGAVQLHAIERLSGGAISVKVREDNAAIKVDRHELVRQGEKLFSALEKWSGDPVERIEQRFGMSVVNRHDPRAPMDSLPENTHSAVVLVHGLDDPGWMWRDLSPQLLDAGYVVIRFEYPNDQPIAESTDLFAIHLEKLKQRGVNRISIVGHSMGGLVGRDVLTRRLYYAGDGSGGERYPQVDQLIMLGTPNHGSSLVWMRGLAEFREQAYRWFKGEGHLRDAVLDGAGEAGRDLHPDSDYLRRLNERPLCSTTKYTIIAGRISPIGNEDLQSFEERLTTFAESSAAPRFLRDWMDGATPDVAAKAVASAVRGLGDGVVSLDSVKLEGVDDMVVVEANHIGMVANIFDSEETPPAIPVVLDRLASQWAGEPSTEHPH